MRFRWPKKLWPSNWQLLRPLPVTPRLKYERLTGEARNVIKLANQEADRFKHEYLGTEHILLGLLTDNSSAAALVLNRLGIEPSKVRANVETLVLRGPDVGIVGKRPQTPRARNVMEYSLEEARRLNHDCIGAEHILLGLLREQEGVGGLVLMQFGLTIENARKEVLRIASC